MRLRAFVLAAVLAAACSSGPSGPSGGTAGRYSGIHSFTITAEGNPEIFNCGGRLVISNVTGSTVTGTLTLNACPPFLAQTGTTTLSGTFIDGQLTVTIPNLSLFTEFFADEGCTVTRLDPGWTGTLQGGRIDVRFTASFTCPTTVGTNQFVWRIDMQKIS